MISVVIPAAGMGKRTGLKENKMFFRFSGKTIIEMTVEKFLEHPLIDRVCVVCGKDEIEKMRSLLGDKVEYAVGGATRGESVYNGLLKVKESDKVLIHDGARPYVDEQTVTNVIDGISEGVCALAGINVVDTLKQVDENGFTVGCPDREKFKRAQTPQGFMTDEIISAYETLNDFTLSDDSQLFEKIGKKVKIVEGSPNNIKITTPEDLKTEKIYLSGVGYDVHQLTENRKLILGGVEIPYEKGLLGHSDADVLLHAICDAILGAAGLGDIGKHFPDSDDKYKGISSLLLLEHVNKLVSEKGYSVVNVSAIVVAQRPKLAPFISQMNEKIAKCLDIPTERVNVAATTTEKLGFEGRGEGISSTATVMLSK